MIIINQKNPLIETSDHPFSLKKSMTLIKHRVFKILILLWKTFWKILVSSIILIGTFGIFHNLNCKSIFVIYMMECILCKIQYIKKAKTPINIRLNHLFVTKFHINNFESISVNNSMKSFTIVFHYVKLISVTMISYSLYKMVLCNLHSILDHANAQNWFYLLLKNMNYVFYLWIWFLTSNVLVQVYLHIFWLILINWNLYLFHMVTLNSEFYRYYRKHFDLLMEPFYYH